MKDYMKNESKIQSEHFTPCNCLKIDVTSLCDN